MLLLRIIGPVLVSFIFFNMVGAYQYYFTENSYRSDDLVDARIEYSKEHMPKIPNCVSYGPDGKECYNNLLQDHKNLMNRVYSKYGAPKDYQSWLKESKDDCAGEADKVGDAGVGSAWMIRYDKCMIASIRMKLIPFWLNDEWIAEGNKLWTQ